MKWHQSEILGICWRDTPEGWHAAAKRAADLGWRDDALWLWEVSRELALRNSLRFWSRITIGVMLVGALLYRWWIG